MTSSAPIIWSIAGLDSAGGAGLSADQRAADALGVHLCPITAALTAQHSQGVEAVFPVAASALQAQMAALSEDLPPSVIKTGLLGSVAAIEAVAKWVDAKRANTPRGQDPHRHLALVVDPVLGASAGGAAFASDEILEAYRTQLLPRATVITPNRAEARRLLRQAGRHDGADADVPQLAADLQALGARSVVITGGDVPGPSPYCIDWLQTPHACGWLTAPRIDTRHTHGSGCTFASGLAASMALGHVEADAAVLAKMLTHHALQQARQAGGGAGPVLASRQFSAPLDEGGAPLPWLGLGTQLPWRLQRTDRAQLFAPFTTPAQRLYGIVPSAAQFNQALHAGLTCVQLRHKAHEGAAQAIADSLDAARQQAHLRESRAEAEPLQVFINDHLDEAWSAFEDVPTHPLLRLGVHLGQEDLLALTTEQQASLLARSTDRLLGLSSHSLWELARAAGCGASVIACGPVQPTTTKDMPWRPQGLNNLAWWVRHSPAPVVAIGGLLTPADLASFARCRPAALCVVRGLGAHGDDMRAHVAAFEQAVQRGLQDTPARTPRRPRPVLP